MSPKRIQRRRTKGWRMPDGAVYVGRDGRHNRWGNPWRVGEEAFVDVGGVYRKQVLDAEMAVRIFREDVMDGDCMVPSIADIRAELRGKDLVTVCPHEHRLKQALYEVHLAIGSGRIDLPKLKTILTTEHEECTHG